MNKCVNGIRFVRMPFLTSKAKEIRVEIEYFCVVMVVFNERGVYGKRGVYYRTRYCGVFR